MNCKPGDVVMVPFPFIDRQISKLRPALVLSNNPDGENDKHLILSMITSAKRSRWKSDIVLKEWRKSGLKAESVVRWKIFTIEAKLVQEKRGCLSSEDSESVQKGFKRVLGI